MRHLLCITQLLLLLSCADLSLKKKEAFDKVESNLDSTTVDFPPSFEVCDSLISKAEKVDCFRNTMHQEMQKNLINQPIGLKPFTDEIVTVVITIQTDRQVKLESLIMSDKLRKQIPTLRAIIEKSIADLPTIRPAIKRSIPVITEYKIPIRFRSDP